MLKGFVLGEEKDIVRIPMKGKNLFDYTTQAQNTADGQHTGTPNTQVYADGTFNTSSSANGWWVSDFIPVSGEYATVSNIGGTTPAICAYDLNKEYIRGVAYDTGGASVLGSATIDVHDAAYVRFTFVRSTMGPNVMLNAGAQALPYEPYGYQEGWEVRDNQDRLIWGREDELQTTTGTLPFKGYGLPISTIEVDGNGQQNGTPTPDNPIIPEFCGDRTGNLIPEYSKRSTTADGVSWDVGSDGKITGSGITTAGTNFYILNNFSIPLKAGTYTLSFVGQKNISLILRDVTTATTICSVWATNKSATFTIDDDIPETNRINLYLNTSQSGTSIDIDGYPMLNTGSTALPYEPYGYKIPITNAGQTTPIYLGQTQTVRRIKRIDIGTLNFNKTASGNFNATLGDGKIVPNANIAPAICTHFKIVSANNYNSIPYSMCASINNQSMISINKTGFEEMTADEFKSAMSGVILWYILANEQTGIVNEPLAKIGDYVDELTTIKVHGLSDPLYGIGDYKDILNLSTGVITRKIKKQVFDGSEPWVLSGNIIYIYNTNTEKLSSLICTHFPNEQNTGMWNGNNWVFQVDISNLGMTTRSAWITYLQQQYASGTPVTVWYILTKSETETVTVPTGMTGEIEGYLTQISTPSPTNRSVPKCNGEEETGGTYAVTVYTPPEIPTTTGQNTLKVDTTLAPYEVTVEGHIKHVYWGKILEYVRSGLAQTRFPVGTIFYDNEDETTGTALQVVGYDKHFDPSLTARGYTHSMTLCQLKLSGPWKFDSEEAFLYTTVEMQPGTYKFKIPNYDTTYGGNKTYYFTSTASVPVDSQITLSWAYQHLPSTVTAYAGPNPQTSTTAITGFNALQLSEWIEGESPEAIDLGTIKLANNDPDSAYGKLNHIHRARYGSNNYYQSGLRQLLNTDLASNNWWHPTTIFDRPYANRTANGYLRSLNEDFINVLATPEITHIANNVFEYPSLDGRTFTLNTEYKINTDKVFLLSHTEVGLSASPNIGTVLDYYNEHNTNTDRIKYRLDNGNAYYWWFRTPYPTNANYLRRCSTSGALSSDLSSYALGVAPAYIIQ